MKAEETRAAEPRPNGFDRLPQILVAISLFLAALMGGTIPMDAMPMVPGQFFSELIGGQLARLAQAIVVIPASLALVITLVRKRVVTIPALAFGLVLVLWFLVLGLSVLGSDYRWLSGTWWLSWLTYGVVFWAIVATCGRDGGVKLAIGALGAGCTLVALKGIAEFAQMRHVDPSWRIFADWVNANALAGMLILGFFALAGLAAVGQGTGRLLGGVAGGVIAAAIVLTQSKGGFLALAGGMVVYSFAMLFWAPKRLPLILVPLAIGALFVGAIRITTPDRPGTAAPLTRVAQGEATREQSEGFRRLLWESAARLAIDNPTGIGLGAYRFESGRPGLNEQTVMAHNTPLQIAAEAGLLAVGLFLIALGQFASLLLRGSRRIGDDLGPLRAAILASLVATLAHGLVESNLYSFGIGFTFFALMGLGSLLSPVGVSPEASPSSYRWVMAGLVVALTLSVTLIGWIDLRKANLLGKAFMRDFPGAQQELRSLQSLAPLDPELPFQAASIAADSADPRRRIAYLRRAADLAPTTRNLRALAREYAETQQFASAVMTLRRALRRDPRNMRTWRQLMTVHRQAGQPEEARQAARELVAIEETSVFKVRSLAEIVPTDTYEARVFLAEGELPEPERQRLLRPAVEGFAAYARLTLPLVLRAAQSDPPLPVAGEDLEGAQRKMAMASEAANELAASYRRTGQAGRAAEIDELAQAFVVPEPVKTPQDGR